VKRLRQYSEEKEVIRELVSRTDYGADTIYVEIGTREGKSLKAAIDGNDHMQIISVDIHQFKKTKSIFANNNVRFIEGDSHKVYKQLKHEGIKFSSIFIDGNHEERYVHRDINDYWNLWDGNGFFGGHDFTKRRGYGVIPAVKEFFGIDNIAKVNRRWKTRGGVLHVCHTVWFFILDENLSYYDEYLKDL